MATKDKAVKYDESNIKNLAGREAVRAKPGMYIGGTDVYAAFSCLRELGDNTVDEALAGRNKFCQLHFDVKANTYWCFDRGQGIPVKDIKVKDQVSGETHTLPAIKAIFTLLHTGGKFDDKAYTVARGCFSGDTKVRLLSGKTITMESLYKRWQRNEKKIPIMSFDRKAMKLTPSAISHVQITKTVNELAYVHLDDGSIVKCTVDHPFFVNHKNKTKKVKAEDLVAGSSLVSTYYSQDRDGYLVQTEQGVNRKVHRVVGEYYFDVTPNLDVVHHASRDKHDNRPSNLEILTKAQHARDHKEERSEFARDKIIGNQEDLRLKNSRYFSEQNSTEEHIAISAATKSVKIAARVLHLYGKITKKTWNKTRRVNERTFEKACAAVGGLDVLRERAQARLLYLKSRVGHSSQSEDELAVALRGRKTAKESSDHANWLKSIQTWRDFLLAQEDPANCTPQEFNKRTGATVFGRYANLCRYSSLDWLKEYVLEGKPELQLHEDQSQEAQEYRMLRAEIRMRDPKILQKMAKLFLSTANKAPRFDEKAYTAIKPSCAPSFTFGTAIVKHVYGQGVNVREMAAKYNHKVLKVEVRRFKTPQPVYDITVDKTHTFFVEPGVLVSNSHGIGSKATNFLAAEFEVWTFRDGKWWHMLFKEGKVVTDLEKVKAGPTNPYTGKVTESGTVIRFIPDPKIFSKRTIPLNYATEWASIAAYFTSDFKVILSTTDKGHKVYHFPAGPKQYVTDRVAKLGCTALSPDVFTLGNALMDCVVQFTDYGSNDLRGFTNGLNNPDGGVHVRAFMAALKKVLTPYAKKRQEFTVKELEEGLVGIVNAKLSAPRFSSQTKEKLVDERAGEPVQELLLPALKKFFASNKSLAEKLCTRAAQLKSLKEGFQLSKNALKELKKVASRLPAKAATCPKAKPEERELVIVEGDSAAGSVRSARDIRYQEMFPLKGKILNALKHTPEKMLESEEVKGILAMLGYDPKQANPYDKLRVGKIICLADPDPDGPLHGDTQVDVFADEMWQTLTMRELASPAWRNREYQVVTWDGGRFILSEAHNCRVTEVSTKAVSLVFDDGTKITCSPNHQFPLYTQKYDQRVQQQLNNGMLMLRADKLKTGDRVCATPIGIDSNGIEGATVPLSFKTVVKCKDHKVDTTQWYCLTVPVYHNFRLASGLMSKNCHINSLLLTLFYRYLPDLFKRGMVYVAETSLFYAYKDKQLVGGDTPEEVEAKLKKLGLKAPVHHCKGYGEVDAHVLRAMAFDPATRKLSRIIPTKGSNGAVEFQKLMSEGTEARKELLGI